jgi:NADH:ubiquinone oxidoreductase subunit 4 (subunit M)
MDWIRLALAATLLPVFPLSLVFNAFVGRLPTWWARAAAAVVLPQVGVELVRSLPSSRLAIAQSTGWIVLVAFSAILYSFRAVSVRELSIWARLMATSGLGLVWIFDLPHQGDRYMALAALAWSVPAALLLVLAGLLGERSGGAYLGLQGGLASAAPRMSGLLTISALALVATPVFPSFFALLRIFELLNVSLLWPLLLLLLIWGWSIGSLLQRLLFGTYCGESFADLGVLSTFSAVVVLVFLVLAPVMWSRAWIGI